MSQKAQQALSQSELKKLNDPNFLVELAIGPPNPYLVPQTPGTGLTVGGQYSSYPRSFVYKKAHLSFDDNRIFDESGEIVLVTHHLGKNPYDSLDPLGLANTDQVVAPYGEWESICNASGYNGMPNFKVRPKHLSIHGRQYVQAPDENVTYFNIAKLSRIKSMSIRHNLAVCSGESKDVVYRVLVDLAGRCMQLVNSRDELEATVTKSTKNLILNAAFGAGSELQIDVAPGVDWTSIVAIIIGLKQVGKSLGKDAVGNFIAAPAANAATAGAVGLATDPSGLDGLAEDSGLGDTVASVGDAAGEAFGAVGDTLGEAAESGGDLISSAFDFISSVFGE